VTVDETTKRAITSLDAQQILELLPHRYPFLLVDRIEQICGDESCVGLKNISFNEPFFQGHFPGRPLMPGVLLVEGMAQTAGAICALRNRRAVWWFRGEAKVDGNIVCEAEVGAMMSHK
jgi:3-hydroxyacyl-[acyl-carrier-protein] dehydratase